MNEEMDRMRIGMVGLITIGGDTPGAAGGVETSVEEISTRLAAMGHDVHVFCRRKYTPPERTQFKGVQLHRLPAVYTKHLEAITHTFLSTLAAIRCCDVIHYHAMGPSLFSWLPRLFGKKTIVTVQGLDWRREKWGGFARFVLKIAEGTASWFPNRTAVVSHFLEAYYGKHYRKPVTYVPNGMPAIPIRPFDKLARFGLEPNRYVLYLSRIVPEKGADILVEAFRKVDTDLKLAVVGDSRHAGEYFDRVKRLAQGDGRIVFTGPLYGEDKDEAYSNAYLFCHPSKLEGLPIVLLEAMGAGRCCLVSDIPEMVEVVDPERLGFSATASDAPAGPHGYTFRDGDPADLAKQLANLIQHPQDVAAMGDNACRYVRGEYNWDVIARAFERLYRDALGGT